MQLGEDKDEEVLVKTSTGTLDPTAPSSQPDAGTTFLLASMDVEAPNPQTGTETEEREEEEHQGER